MLFEFYKRLNVCYSSVVSSVSVCNGRLLTQNALHVKTTALMNVSLCCITVFPSCRNTGAGPLACTTCPAHSMLQNGLCIDCLASQYYDPPTQTCKTCHESCRTCSGPGQFSCLTCPFPLHLDRLNHQCVPCCAADASPDDQSCCHCDKATGKCACVCVCVE